MEFYWIILILGSLIKSSQSVYELNGKRIFDTQSNWRPITFSGFQIPTQHQHQHQYLSASNYDLAATNKYRLNQQNANHNNALYYRQLKSGLIPSSSSAVVAAAAPPQYRSHFAYFPPQKYNKAYVSGGQRYSPHLLNSGSSAINTNYPNNLIPPYNSYIGAGAKPSIYIKPDPISSNTQLNSINTPPLNIPNIYKTYPAFKTSASNTLTGNIKDTHILSTTNPAWIQQPFVSFSTTLSPLYQQQQYQQQQHQQQQQQQQKQSLLIAGNNPLNKGLNEAISSYSFFGPASQLVRNQQQQQLQQPAITVTTNPVLTTQPDFNNFKSTLSTTSLIPPSETTAKSFSTAFPSGRQNLPYVRTSIDSTFWGDTKFAADSKLKQQEFDQNGQPSSSTTSISPYQYQSTADPFISVQGLPIRGSSNFSQSINLDDYSNILVPPPPPSPSSSSSSSSDNFKKIPDIIKGSINDTPGNLRNSFNSIAYTTATISTLTTPTPNRQHFQQNFNKQIYPSDSKIFSNMNSFHSSTEKPISFNINADLESLPEQKNRFGKVTFSLTDSNPNLNEYSPIKQVDYNGKDNFFTIKDAITYPPIYHKNFSRPIESSATNEMINDDKKSQTNHEVYSSSSENSISFKDLPTTTSSTIPPTEAEIYTINSSTPSTITRMKGRRRRPSSHPMRVTSSPITKQEDSKKPSTYLSRYNAPVKSTSLPIRPPKRIKQRIRVHSSTSSSTTRTTTTTTTPLPPNTQAILTTLSASVSGEEEQNGKQKSVLFTTQHSAPSSISENVLLPEDKFTTNNIIFGGIGSEAIRTTPGSVKILKSHPHLHSLPHLPQHNVNPTENSAILDHLTAAVTAVSSTSEYYGLENINKELLNTTTSLPSTSSSISSIRTNHHNHRLSPELISSVENGERIKKIRNRERLRLDPVGAISSTVPIPSSTSTKSSAEDETQANLKEDEIENISKEMKLLNNNNSFDDKRPTFSVKDYKNRLRTQSRKRVLSSTTTTSTIAPEKSSVSATRYRNRLPTRKRLLPTIKLKPLMKVDDNSTSGNISESNLIISENSNTIESSTHHSRKFEKSTKSPIRNTNESHRNGYRGSTTSTSTTTSSPVSKFRKNNTRPQYSSLRERIQHTKNRRTKVNETAASTATSPDDLGNIALDMKSTSDLVVEETNNHSNKPESAIMKIAKNDHHFNYRSRNGDNHRAPVEQQEVSNEDKSSSSEMNSIKSASEASKRVAQLTMANSRFIEYTKNGNKIMRRIPEYFTLATDDPILPIEAFFPNVKGNITPSS